MQTLSRKTARMWSRLGQRGTICGVALPEMLEERSDCYILTADLGTTSGLSRVMQQQPERFVNVGIAEQNLIGVAAGLAFEGNVVFATTFATFLTMRGYEQIRHNLGYQKANVKLIGSAAGFAMGMFGNSHYSYEDIAIMRSIPNMMVISPADAGEAYLAAYMALEHDGPVYIRLSGGLNAPVVYTEPYAFAPGRAVWLREGKDVALIATGGMTADALEAAKRLEADGIQAAVLHMHTIKPLDTDALYACSGYGLVVTIEEHSVIGGLGSAAAEYFMEQERKPRQIRIGIQDTFVRPGGHAYVRQENGLDAAGISQRVKAAVSEGV